MKDTQYKTIEALRFICASLVVLRHSSGFIEVPVADYSLYRIVVATFSFGVTEVCVPVFFMISGFLFFSGLHEWKWSTYGRKLKSRITTLMLPYCVWNVLAVFSSMIITYASTRDINQALSVYNNNGALRILWDCANVSVSDTWFGGVACSAAPMDGPLWFIRDLIVLTLCAPFLYVLIH